jgi:hypothetical protein
MKHLHLSRWYWRLCFITVLLIIIPGYEAWSNFLVVQACPNPNNCLLKRPQRTFRKEQQQYGQDKFSPGHSDNIRRSSSISSALPVWYGREANQPLPGTQAGPVLLYNDLYSTYTGNNLLYYYSDSGQHFSMDVGLNDTVNAQQWIMPNLSAFQPDVPGIATPLSQTPYDDLYFPLATHCLKYSYPDEDEDF